MARAALAAAPERGEIRRLCFLSQSGWLRVPGASDVFGSCSSSPRSPFLAPSASTCRALLEHSGARGGFLGPGRSGIRVGSWRPRGPAGSGAAACSRSALGMGSGDDDDGVGGLWRPGGRTWTGRGQSRAEQRPRLPHASKQASKAARLLQLAGPKHPQLPPCWPCARGHLLRPRLRIWRALDSRGERG